MDVKVEVREMDQSTTGTFCRGGMGRGGTGGFRWRGDVNERDQHHHLRRSHCLMG